MAELVVSFALDRLRDHIEEGLGQRADQFVEVLDRRAGEEALKIDKAIDEMKGFLNDADWKRENNDLVKAWVGKARALAYRVEDQVDGYRTRTRMVVHPTILSVLAFMYGFVPLGGSPYLIFVLPVIFMVLNSADKIAAPWLFRRRLQEISKEIDAVIMEMKGFNFEYTIKETVSVHDAEAPPLPSAGMVGMVDEAKQAKKWLLENVQDGVVVFIIGVMGIGKTTLAANVYEETKNHFDCHTWVFLSQPFDKMVTLKEILRGFYESCSESAPSNLEDMSEEDLRKAVSSYLTQKKKHLLVLDGVRDLQTLEKLNLNLLLQHGGKIIVTTTDSTLPRVVITNEEDDVGQVPANESANIIDEDLHRRRSVAAGKLPVVAADIAGPSNRPSREHTETTQHRYVYDIVLKKLPSHESRELLRSKALPSGREFPGDLETIVEEILQKCEGLPISIVTVGSLLSTKESKPEEWQKVVDLLNNIGQLTSKDIFVSSGYSDLSPVLKQCFLYCGIFPENYRISKKRLIRMWVAEGFVDKIKKKTQEEAAEQQLDELIKRNMLQVAGKDLKGDIQSCRLLNLMSDFARTMSSDDNFCAVVRSPDDHKFDWKELRRLSTEDVAIIRNSQLVTARKLRSLLFFGAITTNLPSSLTQNSTTSKEIISSNLQIPILKLTIHIPYIIRSNLLWCIPTNILFSWIQSVPLTFVMLRVLELHGLRINVLPSEVGDLILLRYLGLRKTGIAALPKSIIHLSELETLDIRQTNVRQMPDLFRLKKLRHLYMEGSFMNRVVSLSEGVMWLTQLQTLAGARITDNLSEQLSYLTGLRKLSLGKAQEEHSEYLCKALSKMTLLQSLNIKCDWGEKFSLEYLANSTRQYNLRDHDLENFQHFPHLSKLKLGGCMDSLVNWVSKIHSLAYLYLWDSQLSDDPLCKLKHLNKLLLLSINNAYDGTKMSLEGDGFRSLKKLSIIRLRNLKTVSITEGAMLKLEHLFFAQCPKLKEPPACIQHLNDFKTMQVAAMPLEFEDKALKMSSQGNGFRVQRIRQIITASS